MNGYQIVSESLKLKSDLYIFNKGEWIFLTSIDNYSSGSETYFFKIDKDKALKLSMDQKSATSSYDLQKKASNFKLAPRIMKYKLIYGVHKFKIDTSSSLKSKTTKDNKLRINKKEIIGYGYFTEIAELINKTNKHIMIKQLPELKSKLEKYGFSTRDLGISNLGIIKDKLVLIDFSPSSQKEI